MCGTSLQRSRLSVPPPPSGLSPSPQDLSLLTIPGPAVATSNISIDWPTLPHTEGSTGSGFKAPPHLIRPGRTLPLPNSPLGPNTQNNTVEMANVFSFLV